MRFNDFDPDFALLRFGDGRPFKVDANEAAFLPDRVYEFNEQLFQLLTAAFEKKDTDLLESLWAAAHRRFPPAESGGMQVVSPSASTDADPLPPNDLRG